MRCAARLHTLMSVWLGLILTLSPLAARPKPDQQAGHSAPAGTVPSTSAPVIPAAKPERPVPFKAGETLEYDVSWSSFLTAGTATVTVLDKRPSFGSTAYYIYAEGRPTPFVARLYSLYYKVDTLLDVYALLPQRAAMYSDENGRRRLKVTRFDQANRKADYEVQTTTVEKKPLALRGGTQDLLSVLYVIRASPLLEGGRITMPVANDGGLYTVRATVGAKESIRNAAGTFSAWRVTLQVLDGDGGQAANAIVIWISDDARRLPVKLETELPVGQFVLALRTVKP